MLMPDEKAPYTLMILTARRLPGERGHSSSPTARRPDAARTRTNAELQGNVVDDSASGSAVKSPGGDVANVAGKTKGGSTMTIAAAVVAVLVLGVVAVMMMRKSGTDTATETVAYTPTPPPTSTSIPAPIGPTPEEAFQDHYAGRRPSFSRPTRPPRGKTPRLLPPCSTIRAV